MITCDIESNSLLTEEVVDYLSSPYKLKDSFEMHCIVIEDHETGEIIAFYDGDTYDLDGRPYNENIDGLDFVLENYTAVKYTHKQLSEFPTYIQSGKYCSVVGHNFIEFDILALKLWYGLDYSIKYNTWGCVPFEVKDTLVISKTLNADRFGGHSLDNLSKSVGVRKIDFRPKTPKHLKFKYFAADMLYYCIRDVVVNTKVYKALEKESEGWGWEESFRIEHRVKDIITRGSHRGLKFNKTLAEDNVKELDKLMEERRLKVTPVIPPKSATKKFMATVTPPKRQFKDGGASIGAQLEKFVNKHNGEIIKIDNTGIAAKDYTVDLFGTTYNLPLDNEPLITTESASIDDTTHIKNWLVGFGWNPSEYKEKDLTVKQVKGMGKVKRTQKEYEVAVKTYVEQTLSSNFCKDRCDFLGTTKGQLEKYLLSKKINRSVKVITNPSFTVGQDKEMDSNLEVVVNKFPFAKDIVEYLTYKHRRNSILGGGLEWDDEGEAEKGYLAYIREDGRIPTPADSCGAATSRFKHRVVANIPRVTSLFGAPMRALFGVGDDRWQIGYDFSSLEARIEGHYCWKYDKGDKAYCNALTLDKPNDVHSKLAREISKIINRPFERSSAKSVKYGCSYGATAAKVAKIIGEALAIGTKVFDAFWVAAFPLGNLRDKLKSYWEIVGGKKFVLGIDGRKIPTRSAHSIINSLFQSGGVICAKMTMIYFEDLLEEEGLLIDFFKDDWKNSVYCQQLIAYHDECQLEVSKELVKFKLFTIPKDATDVVIKEIKQEAEVYKNKIQEETNTVWSDVAKSDKGWYIAHSVVGELIKKAVDMTSDRFNLNIPLGADYIVGRNWAECH